MSLELLSAQLNFFWKRLLRGGKKVCCLWEFEPVGFMTIQSVIITENMEGCLEERGCLELS